MSGLNIVAERKVSLKGFAEGWDDCYLLVRAANPEKAREWAETLKPDTTDEETDKILRGIALELIIGGSVITTKEDGTKEPVVVNKEDVPEVLRHLSFAWVSEVVSVATGADRLKALMSF